MQWPSEPHQARSMTPLYHKALIAINSKEPSQPPDHPFPSISYVIVPQFPPSPDTRPFRRQPQCPFSQHTAALTQCLSLFPGLQQFRRFTSSRPPQLPPPPPCSMNHVIIEALLWGEKEVLVILVPRYIVADHYKQEILKDIWTSCSSCASSHWFQPSTSSLSEHSTFQATKTQSLIHSLVSFFRNSDN